MTFDWTWSDLYFGFCCCWLALQQEPALLLASAENALLADASMVLKSCYSHCKEVRPCKRPWPQSVKVEQVALRGGNEGDTQESNPTM